MSYRFNNKFEEAKTVLKQVFDFLVLFELECLDMEWVVTNWCKIKRDMKKSKSALYTDDTKKMSIVDFLPIKPNLSHKFLIEEKNNYYHLR